MRAVFLMAALVVAWPALAADAVLVPVLAHAIARGDIVTAEDFERQPRAPFLAAGIVGPADAGGREAARNLSAGAVVRPGDLVTPRLVRRGEPVTLALRSGGLVITAAGRALSSGGSGEAVRVVVTATNRTLDGIIEGSGAVRVRVQ